MIIAELGRRGVWEICDNGKMIAGIVGDIEISIEDGEWQIEFDEGYIWVDAIRKGD